MMKTSINKDYRITRMICNRFMVYGLLWTLITLSGCKVSKVGCPCEAPQAVKIGQQTIMMTSKVVKSDTNAGTRITIRLAVSEGETFPKQVKCEAFYIRSLGGTTQAEEGILERKNEDKEQSAVVDYEGTARQSYKEGEETEVAAKLVDRSGKVQFIRCPIVKVTRE